jgi:hypothetical protein
MIMAHFIPLKDTKTKAKDLALIFAQNIWQLHRFPTEIVSNWIRRFIINLWSSLYELLAIGQKVSKLFQPKPDGQTKRVN